MEWGIEGRSNCDVLNISTSEVFPSALVAMVEIRPPVIWNTRSSVLKLRHIIGSTAVGDLPGNGAGNIAGPCRYGSDRLAGEGSPVAGCHAAKSPGDKADASACSHRRTALYHSIAHIGIRLKAACKPCKKSAACRSACCSRCAACPRGICCLLSAHRRTLRRISHGPP